MADVFRIAERMQKTGRNVTYRMQNDLDSDICVNYSDL